MGLKQFCLKLPKNSHNNSIVKEQLGNIDV